MRITDPKPSAENIIAALYRKCLKEYWGECYKRVKLRYELGFPRMWQQYRWVFKDPQRKELNRFIEVALYLNERCATASHVILDSRVYLFDVAVNNTRLQALIRGEKVSGTDKVVAFQLRVPGEGESDRERIEVEIQVPTLYGRHARPEVHLVLRMFRDEVEKRAKSTMCHVRTDFASVSETQIVRGTTEEECVAPTGVRTRSEETVTNIFR